MTDTGGSDVVTTASPTGGHAARSDRLLVRTAVLFRLGGVAQIAFALSTVSDGYRDLGPALLLAAVVLAESAAVTTVWWRRRRLDPRLLTADMAFCSVMLVVEGGMTTASGRHTWAFFMYPFTLVACVAVGAGYRRLVSVLLATTIVAAGYVVATLIMQQAPPWGTAPNSLSYYANTVITWLIARELRRQARAADIAEADAVARAAELAAERESTRYARMLHDRVLQTLEMLAKGNWVVQPEVRAHIAGEAVWLRGLLSGVRPDDCHDILTGLQLVAQDQALRGLQIELNGVGLLGRGLGSPVPVETVDAVCGAVREAVTNVGKHAGVASAVVRVSFDHDRSHLVVSVVDQGAGFDPSASAAGGGLGLRRSVQDRIAAVGGLVHIDSTVGGGTHIELRVPVEPTSRT